ncbi:4Fe-4S dicluster domain-containing protein [Sorangium sp. So ce887]|uniref:4Fe-4S dicluster domain-containing protein n=1 Tax=Sorangium sp. So ce887 TaxID=3133324 RepID=UPI003F62DFE2
MSAERPKMRRRDLLRIFSPGPEAPRGSTRAPAAAFAPARAAAFAPAPAAAFSLDAFYAQRVGAGAVTGETIPAFGISAPAEVPAPRAGAAEQPSPPPWRRGGAEGALPPGAVLRLLPHACIALESFCSVCVERCPAEGALVMELGRPKLDEDRCTGCGRCVEVCPAPVRGFTVVPRALPQGAPRHA